MEKKVFDAHDLNQVRKKFTYGFDHTNFSMPPGCYFFDNRRLEGKYFQEVVEDIRRQQKEFNLWLEGCDLPENNLQLLCDAVVESGQLQDFELRYTERDLFQDGRAEPVLQLLSQSKKLKQLFFWAINLSTKVSEFLHSLTSSTLTILQLSNCSLTSDDAKDVATFVETQPSLKYLDLDRNNFGDLGIGIIFPVLMKTSLKHLDLSVNNASAKMITKWNLLFKSHPTLESFELASGVEELMKDTIKLALETGEMVPHNRTKLMVAGKGGAGKTTTVRSLLGEEFISTYSSTIVANMRTAELYPFADSEGDSSRWVSIEEKPFAGDASMLFLKHVSKVDGSFSTPIPSLADKMPSAMSRIKLSFNKLYRRDRVKMKGIEKQAEIQVPTEILDTYVNEITEIAGKDKEGSRKVIFSIWDLGGQKVFECVNHLFLNSFGILLVVFDLAWLAISEVKAKAEYDSLFFWLKCSTTVNVPIIIVGTHLDEVKQLGLEFLKEVNEHVNSIILEAKALIVLRNEDEKLSFFPVDNSSTNYKEDESVKKLRQAIESVVRGSYPEVDVSYLSTPVKLSWALFLQVLLQTRKEKMSLGEILEVAKQYQIVESEVVKLLRHYADLGCLIHFVVGLGANDLIVFQPKWLIVALANILYDVDLHGTKSKLVAGSKIKYYEQTGIVSQSVLYNAFWNDLYSEGEKVFLTKLCLKSLIMSEYTFGDTNFDELSYLIPGMIQERNSVASLPNEGLSFGFLFEPNIPLGLFQRLLCCLMSKCANLKTEAEPKMGKSMASFELKYFDDEFYLWVNLLEDKGAIQFTLEAHEKDLSFRLLSAFEQDLFKIVLGAETSRGLTVKAFVQMPSNPRLTVSYKRLIDRWRSRKSTVRTENEQMVDIKLFEIWLPEFAGENPQYDCFLAHAWGGLMKNKKVKFEGHEKVKTIAKQLQKSGLVVWLDEVRIRKDPGYEIEIGLSQSKAVLVFLTESYFDKLQDMKSNVYKEFTSAVLRDPKFIIPIILEARFKDEHNWPPSVARFQLSAAFRFHMTNDLEIKDAVPKLVEHLRQL